MGFCNIMCDCIALRFLILDIVLFDN
jgi:hypothetical protein